MNLLIVIFYLAYAGTIDRPNDGSCPKLQLERNDARANAWEKSVQKYKKKRIDVTEAEQLSLKELYRDIGNAYTNRQIEAMAQAMACVSNRIDFIQDDLFFELNTGILRLFGGRFFDSGRSCHFASTAEFERFVELHTKTALFLGDCYCRRNDYDSGMMVWIEYQTFIALRKFVDQFHREGKTDFEQVAQKSLDKWIEHIESDQGFIRRNAHYQMDMSWPLIELGKITREGARRGALSGVDILIKHGYTPKWLDEFK